MPDEHGGTPVGSTLKVADCLMSSKCDPPHRVRTDLLKPDHPPQPEQFRSYLLLLARTHLGPQQQARVDPSDIVQFTLLEAHQKQDQFQGSSQDEMAGWLRRMLSFNIADAFRALKTHKRDVQRERSLDDTFDNSCSRLNVWLEAVQTSPSGQATRNEQLVRLATAMETLPDTQREAIELHHLHGMTLVETAAAMDRTAPAVIGLLRRGLSRLRELLQDTTTWRPED